MKIEHGSKFVMIGDSITDMGRDRSGEATPWNPDTGFGKGYVNFLNALITSEMPERRIRIINRGISGNNVRDLKARWDRDVLELKPDWLSVCIGINDIWRQFDTPLNGELHVNADEFEGVLDGLLASVRKGLKGLVLISPFVLEPNLEDGMRRATDSYGKIVAGLAVKHSALWVDAQSVLERLMEHIHPSALAWDRIHLNSVGHMALAQAVLAELR
ncbi:MAG: SGNH/GDSL hydrolase family protein [Planctomycetes bacterium]|nr:SGNH/GDSL hydrolase family protein [Planctomycetota bacterium]